jgi:segregation and condensation protein A
LAGGKRKGPHRAQGNDGQEGQDEADSESAGVIPEAAAFKVALPTFEGPLDLLLHLIREHKLDIFDIPIALITERYLAYLELMEALNLDIAGEFLVMAATLAHIKSRLLLPREESGGQEEEEDGEDPREALVRRLLEHQKYVQAGTELGQRGVLGRDSFARAPSPEVLAEADGPEGLAEVSVFKLIEAFDKVLKAARVEVSHEVLVDRLSIGDAIQRISERLTAGSRVPFTAMFEPLPGELRPERHRVVVTFLAILEMVKLRLLRVFQERADGEILLAGRDESAAPAGSGEVGDDYRS